MIPDEYGELHFTLLKKQYDEFLKYFNGYKLTVFQQSDLTVTVTLTNYPTQVEELCQHCVQAAIPYSITYMDGITPPLDFRYDQYGTGHWNSAKSDIPPTVDPSFTHQYEYSRLHLLMRIVNT